MGDLAPLAMSQTKDDLLRHLDITPQTYSLMAKETDRVYVWLISQKAHLKDNCKRKPPYDWSDIKEQYKEEAMQKIAAGGDAYTVYYWMLAKEGDGGCPNWVARWFLYHKFRYRDGRNRAQKDNRHGSSSKHKHKHRQSTTGGGGEDYQDHGFSAGSNAQGYSPLGSSGSGYYHDGGQYTPDIPSQSYHDSSVPGTYYDPVRDI